MNDLNKENTKEKALSDVRDYQFGDKKFPLREIENLVQAMSNSGGFTAPKLAKTAKLIKDIFSKQHKKLRWISFPACLMATGTRGFFVHATKNKFVDIIITTCGTLDHDIARTLGTYKQGRFNLDDNELFNKGYSRLGNVLVPIDTYGPTVEKFLDPIIKSEKAAAIKNKKIIRPVDLIWRIGEKLNHEKSLLTWAAKNKIPIIVPGLVDGAVGAQIQLNSQDKGDWLDIIADQHLVSDLVWDAESSEALMIGGGISKHHVIWWNQYRGGLDKAAYITTAVEHDGSLSGARLREAISWGKIKNNAEHIVLEGEASIMLALIGSYLFN